jgi:diaminohydroxyphosphoribosylaminopyrimidine deaminase/5-amino-6-(5-phosphoribosylamino)uracil reductase
MVGAVIVKEGRIIGQGYHKRYGDNHAETNAICNASESVAGATMYITLEPCSHHGKTPPCAEMLLAHKPARVVVGSLDPNPLVAGRGIKMLQKNGIATTIGVLEEDCRKLNEQFLKFIQTRIPFVTLKYAQTIDGRIATATGHSQWISSEASRRYAHTLRSINDSVLVGAGTVIQDDPELTVRMVKGKNPLRVVVDSQLRSPADAKIFSNQHAAKTMIATTGRADAKKLAWFQGLGIEMLQIDENDRGQVDLAKLLRELGKRNIASLLVEGGSEIITSFIKDALADRVIVIMAPKIIGTGKYAVGDLSVTRMNEAFVITEQKITKKGDDLILEGKITRRENH